MTFVAAANITAADWQLVQTVARTFGVDPYLLVAIGLHETAWGSAGDGRPPPDGHGTILGVGAYDSGSVITWAGLEEQLHEGAATLIANDVHTIADVEAGKLHVDASGRDHWASADTAAAGYPWSTAVAATAHRITGQTFTAPPPSSAWPGPTTEDTVSPADIDAIATAVAAKIDHTEVIAGQRTLDGSLQHIASAVDGLVNLGRAIATKLGVPTP